MGNGTLKARADVPACIAHDDEKVTSESELIVVVDQWGIGIRMSSRPAFLGGPHTSTIN